MQTAHFSTHLPAERRLAIVSGPRTRLRMVYNCRDGYEAGGRDADRHGLGRVRRTARGTLTLLILAALAATILVGCGGRGRGIFAIIRRAAGAGDGRFFGGGRRRSRRNSRTLGHPALGSADAPVVLTEYSDYQ